MYNLQMEITNIYDFINKYKEKNNLEVAKDYFKLQKILKEKFKNKIAINLCMYNVTKGIKMQNLMYDQLAGSITRRLKLDIEHKNFKEIKYIKKILEDNIEEEKIAMKLFFNFYTLEKRMFIIEIIENVNVDSYVEENIIKYCSNKLTDFDSENIKRYEFYIYACLLGKKYKEVNDFTKYILKDNNKIPNMQQICKAYERYGEKNIPVTDEFSRIMLWKYAVLCNTKKISSIMQDYKNIFISDNCKQHLTVHNPNSYKQKNVFNRDAYQVIKEEFYNKKDMDVYYNREKRKITLYIRCDNVIGKGKNDEELNCLKLVLDNLGRVITGYPV